MVHEDFMKELFQPVVQAAAVREAASPYAAELAALRVARQQIGLGHMTLDAGGKGNLGIPFTEKYIARYKTTG